MDAKSIDRQVGMDALGDLIRESRGEHVTDGNRPCWCDPAVEQCHGVDVVIHRDPAQMS